MWKLQYRNTTETNRRRLLASSYVFDKCRIHNQDVKDDVLLGCRLPGKLFQTLRSSQPRHKIILRPRKKYRSSPCRTSLLDIAVNIQLLTAIISSAAANANPSACAASMSAAWISKNRRSDVAVLPIKTITSAARYPATRAATV